MLLVDDAEAGYLTKIETLPDGFGTLLTFTVLDAAAHLKQGTQLAVQMGNEAETRANLGSGFETGVVKPLDADTAARYGLPRSLEK